jgi:hypothetical protein
MNATWLPLLTAVLGLASASLLAAAGPPAPDHQPRPIRILVLPFSNASGDAAWDDWAYALPANIRSCLVASELTELPDVQELQAAMERAEVDVNTPLSGPVPELNGAKPLGMRLPPSSRPSRRKRPVPMRHSRALDRSLKTS